MKRIEIPETGETLKHLKQRRQLSLQIKGKIGHHRHFITYSLRFVTLLFRTVSGFGLRAGP
jgi:hypothetical protein